MWCQIKADITGKKITTLQNKEIGCLGTAILAGVGSGVYSSIENAVEKLVKSKDVILPSNYVDQANKVYQRFIDFDNLLHKRNKNL